MSGAFQAKYTDDQRDAICAAVIDRGATMTRAVKMAKAGQLATTEGTALDPFEIPYGTVQTIVHRERKARLGKRPSTLAQLPPRDSTEQLRQALVSAIEHKLARLRKRLDRDETSVSFEDLRQAARALRELQALPGPNEPRTTAPGQRENGKQDGGQTRGGMAGALIAAHRGGTAQDTAQSDKRSTENGAAQDTARSDDGATAGMTESAPGSVARADAAPVPAAA